MNLFWCICSGVPSTSTLESKRDVSAIKRVLSRKLHARLKQRGESVASLARELGTSRTAVQRVLDPKNTSITLHTMVRAANSLGYKVSLTMEPRIDRIEKIDAPAALQPALNQLGDALDRLPAR
jgi:transcriptional regulator with XRE-family HTH domain